MINSKIANLLVKSSKPAKPTPEVNWNVDMKMMASYNFRNQSEDDDELRRAMHDQPARQSVRQEKP